MLFLFSLDILGTMFLVLPAVQLTEGSKTILSMSHFFFSKLSTV